MKNKVISFFTFMGVFYFGYLIGLDHTAEEYKLEVKGLKIQQENELEIVKKATMEAALDVASTKFTNAFRENCGQENGGMIILENRTTKVREVYRCSLVEEFVL